MEKVANMKQAFFWRDLENFQGDWAGLLVEVPRAYSSRPAVHLLTGNNARMKLMFNDTAMLPIKDCIHDAI